MKNQVVPECINATMRHSALASGAEVSWKVPMTDSDNTLQSIRPMRHARIMDLVAQSGVSVDLWGLRQDGTVRDNPSDNPNYCYEWTFGGGSEPTVLCVWHVALNTTPDGIEYSDNYRELAIRLDRLADQRFAPTRERSRAKSQAPRAQDFDRAVQSAFRGGRELRIVTLVGDQRDSSELGVDASKVKYRLLDPEPWHVVSYGDDGSFKIRRGAPKVEDNSSMLAKPAVEVLFSADVPYVDQFSEPVPVERREAAGFEYVRSPKIRWAVLLRAGGHCEYCGAAGFPTMAGSIYLETHHIIPLGEGGSDTEQNVIALCPNDHRVAHFSVRRDELRVQLSAIVSKRIAELSRSSFAPV